jgi:uncharacterized protein (DUF1800 family)
MKKFAIALTLVGVAILTAYAPDYSQFNQPLAKDQEILHALDRLTFGPRPRDIEAVKKIGLKKWIDQQLHPDRIDENPELAAHLAPLDSLRMSQSQLVEKYPTAQAVQAIMAGRLPMPKDPDTRAAVELQARRRQAKQNGKAGLPPPADGDQASTIETLQKLLDRDQIRTLRNGTPEEKQGLLQSLPQDTRDQVLGAMPAGMRQQLMASSDPATRRKLMTSNTPQQVVPSDLTEGKLYRAIYSNRQLEEQMVDFWFNHFNVYLDKGADRILTTSYERDAIRPHVFGKFRDLLEATASSPAMLFYLDNWQSVSPDRAQQQAQLARRFGKQRAKQQAKGKQQARGLNENYARELMELHTLGVDGGYTQQDIIEVARCFTGWTILTPQIGGEFTYNDRVHDKGEKTVLGVKIPAGGGREDAEKVLDILARHPSTARFISTKLANKFVADDPPPALIDRMAKTFHDSDGDIRAVMTTMLESKEFFSMGAFRAKVKTPLEMIVSAVRATGAEVDYAMPLGNQIAQLGQPLYRKVEPTGYSSANAEWVNSAALLARMNFALALADNRVAGVKLDSSHLQADPASAARQLLFADATQQTITSITNALKLKEPTPALVSGLVLGSPDFQRR